MRSGRAAQALLSLVLPEARAAAVVGDLLEDPAARGLRFWVDVARTAAGALGRSLATAPPGMFGAAVVGWFVYMLASLLFTLAGVLLLYVVWALLYLAASHTGVELITDAAGWRVGWPDLDAAAPLVGLVAMCLVAPFWFGRESARRFHGSEVTAGVIVALVWQLMAVLVPFALFTRATAAIMPVIGVCVIAGAVRARWKWRT
jgi:hypothetical protein